MAGFNVGAAILQTVLFVDGGGTAAAVNNQVIDHPNGMAICHQMEERFHHAPTKLENGISVSVVQTKYGRSITRESSCVEIK